MKNDDTKKRTKNAAAVSLGRRGGKSKSERKRAASMANLAKAREVKRKRNREKTLLDHAGSGSIQDG